jgi:hypothetical protein
MLTAHAGTGRSGLNPDGDAHMQSVLPLEPWMPRLTSSRLAGYADLTIDAIGSRASVVLVALRPVMALAQPDHLTRYILDAGGRI